MLAYGSEGSGPNHTGSSLQDSQELKAGKDPGEAEAEVSIRSLAISRLEDNGAEESQTCLELGGS